MKLFYILFLLLLHDALGQNTFDRKQVLESYIEAYANHDSTSIQQTFDEKLHSPGNLVIKDDILIVKNVLLANATARARDAFNPKSDSLFVSAIQSAHHKKDLFIWANTEYGFYLYTYRQLAKSMPYFVRAVHQVELSRDADILYPANCFKKIAYFITTLGDHEQALKFLVKAQKKVKPGTIESGDILNAMGHCYLALDDLPKAEEYYQKALKESTQSGDYIRQAKTLGSMAEIYRLNRQYDKAEKALKQDLHLSTQYNNPQNTMFVRVQLAKLALEQNKLNIAETELNAAMEIAKSKTYYKKNEYEIVQFLIELYGRQHNSVAELEARRRLDSLERETALLDGNTVLQQVGLKAQKEILNLSLETERNKLKQASLVRNVIILMSILVLLTLLFIIIAHRRRNKLRLTNYENRVMKLQLEKVTSENKLNETRKTLSAYRDYLGEKNTQIEKLRREIKQTRNSPLSVIESRKGKLEELLKSHLMSESNWQNFKEVFVQEEPAFYQSIIENLDGLTDSNLRILFLQKMGFNNPRIAQILGITVDAVKKNKQRMRKKYGESYNSLFGADKVEEEDADTDSPA